MNTKSPSAKSAYTLPKDKLQSLIDTLGAEGYTVIGPTAHENAVVNEPITKANELPFGYTTAQEAAEYRLIKNGSEDAFAFVTGPVAWKRYLYPPVQMLWQVEKQKDGFVPENGETAPVPKYAFLGVRPCDLEAIKKYDKIFWKSKYPDKTYAERRENLFIIAANCTVAGNTCFCVSMNTGPKATEGFDLALTEIHSDGKHAFLIEAGSDKGEAFINKLKPAPAGEKEISDAEARIKKAASNMGRTLTTKGLREALYLNYETSWWDNIADRCYTCGNCTMVCPTCFCTTIEDTTSLAGDKAQRIRKWDSCYNNEFSYIHGGSVRTSSYARYRHWMVHKLASWHDQFDTSGCVGCGRCITWCPAGIDLTKEASIILVKKPKGRSVYGKS